MPSSAAAPRSVETSRPRRALIGVAIGVAVTALLTLARGTTIGEALDLRLTDLRTRRLAGARAPDPRIVLCQVFDEDVRRVQDLATEPWPWDLSTVNAPMFDVMRKAGVKAVLVDVLQLDRGAGPDDLPPGPEASEAMRQQKEIEAGKADDLAKTWGDLKSVALGLELAATPAYELEVRAEPARARLRTEGLVAPSGAIARAGANLPVRRLGEAAAVVGFVNAEEDSDGTFRRASTLGRWGSRTVMSLPLAAASLVTGTPPRLEGGALVVGDSRQPVEPDGSFLIDFRGPPLRTYPRVAPWQLLAWAKEEYETKVFPEAARKALAGKIVVWGVNLSGLKDVLASPMSGVHDGPEIQATILDDLLNGGGRVRASRLGNALVLLLAASLVGAGVAALRGRFLPQLVPIAVGAGVVAFAFVTFSAGTVFDLATPVAGTLLAWGATMTWKQLTEGRYNRWLEATFSRYLAPSVIESLKADPSLLHLGGSRRELSVLFSDVAGFTTHSRRLRPEQLVELLNRYLTAHCDAVFAQGGVVDKFIGDAVVAFYGDPIPMGDHAVRACRTALAVIDGLGPLGPTWKGMGLPEFHVRIGINSGPAVVGNMGSEQRFDYTVMGDTVNLASRLEGSNKVFGSTILVGPATAEEAKDAVVTKPLARLVVVGWDEPVLVHELLATRERATPDLVAHVEAFVRATDAARAGDLAAAARALDTAERLRPNDGPCRWLRGLLAEMKAGRAPTPWSGVLTLTGK